MYKKSLAEILDALSNEHCLTVMAVLANCGRYGSELAKDKIIKVLRTYASAIKYLLTAYLLIIAFCSYHDICSLSLLISNFINATKEAKI